MAFALEPSVAVTEEIRRAACERVDNALALLASLDGPEASDPEDTVHAVRKRCKEARALARLVRTSIGSEFGAFNALVRDAAVELASIRDAHATLATLDDLRAARGIHADARLDAVRAGQSELVAEATRTIHSDDPQIARAIELLSRARTRIDHWDIDRGTKWLIDGLSQTYRRGRRDLARAQGRATDDRMHEWRKAVKTLWYQVRLLEAAAPSILTPLIARLDDLAESLGDDHDLAVLIARLDADPGRFGGKKSVHKAVALARAQQHDLRKRAFRLGESIYVERTTDFVRRVGGYWTTTIEQGPELPTGGIAALAADEQRRSHAGPLDAGAPPSGVERERKFLVSELPTGLDAGSVLRQGYLAIDGSVSVRVRHDGDGDCTLTLKAGRGAVRTELEFPITEEQFETTWPLTRGRRIHKTRYRLPVGQPDAGQHVAEQHVAELDVFHDELDGIVIVEVEFDSEGSMAAFAPPDWFGEEVTDDLSYTNASLAARVGRSGTA